MKTKSQDESVYRLLKTEANRCESMIARIEQEILSLPRGSLAEKKLKKNGKVYVSHCLKYRENQKIISVHIPKEKLPEIEQAILRKKRLQESKKDGEKRVKTIQRLLKGTNFEIGARA